MLYVLRGVGHSELLPNLRNCKDNVISDVKYYVYI